MHLFSGTSFEGATVADMDIDANQNIYVAGEYYFTGDFDPGPGVHTLTWNALAGSPGWRHANYYVSKFDSLGSFVWAYGIQNSDTTIGDILVEASDAGYAIIAGGFGSHSAVDFDPGPGQILLTSHGGAEDIFITRANDNGSVEWAYEVGRNQSMDPFGGQREILDLDLDAKGNIYITGLFLDSMDFDPDPVGSKIVVSNAGSLFILKLTPDAEYDTLLEFPINNFLLFSYFHVKRHHFGLDINDSGEIFIYGSIQPGNGIDTDPGPGTNIVSGNSSMGFVQKLDTNLSVVWNKTLDYAPLAIGHAISEISEIQLDGDSMLYLAGQFKGHVDFDPGTGSHVAISTVPDPYFLKWTQNGDFEWVYILDNGGSTSERSNQGSLICPGPDNLIVASGWVTNTLDFDPGPGMVLEGPDTKPQAQFTLLMDRQGNFVDVDVMDNDYFWFNQYLGGLKFLEDGSILKAGHFRDSIDVDPDTSTYYLHSNAPPSYFRFNCFFQQLSLDSCNKILVETDSLVEVGCNSAGNLYAQAFRGNAPYTYSWNTNPVQNGPSASFSSLGTYTLTVGDSTGCSIDRYYFIPGPENPNDFDLKTNLTLGVLRPGFPASISLNAFNDGCTMVSGDLCLVLDSVLQFDSASIQPSSFSGDTLCWTFSDLNFDSAYLNPIVYVTVSPASIPGNQVCLETYITPFLLDVDSTNNRKLYCIPIIGSYDPNDKQVYPQGECASNYILPDSSFTYTIRFQNTGNAPAINIKILDEIDQSLDLNSFSVVGSSHEYPGVEILTGNVVQFSYDSIMLPDSVHNEPMSHGYVMFEIKPKPGLPDGTRIENTADIYFDFNSPIQTNTVFSTMVNSIPYVDASVSVNNKTLVANMPGVQYQWVTCDSGSVDPGDTLRTFTPTLAGTYACIITYQGCSKTSDCIHVNPLGIEQGATDKIRIFPNPSSGSFSINLDHGSSTGNSLLIIRDIGGKQVYTKKIGNERVSTLDLDLSSGMYILTIRREDNEQRIKLIIE